MRRLELKAGRKAIKLIRDQGFGENLIRGVVSAAGGPKWFTTYALTRYVIHDLTSKADGPIHYLGSSVGAWQMTAAVTSSPGESIDRLRDAYANFVYSDNPDAEEISEACHQIILAMLDDEAPFILSNKHRILHIITAKGKGLINGKTNLSLLPGFVFTALSNALNRRFINLSVERRVFSNFQSSMFSEEKDVLPTYRHMLNENNMVEVLRASGAIPMMMKGIYDIPDAPKGGYWDGGITDYQISLPYDFENGIVLHPHFSPHVLAGWFDKKLPWIRKATPENMSNVLLIYPSHDYIMSLPKKRISELKDFERFGKDQAGRIKYWNEISQKSHELAEEFHELIETGRIIERIKPYN